MELKPGYKQTEVGVIPEDWRDVLLDRVTKRGSGHTPDKKYPEYWNGTIKWISLADSDALDALYIDDTYAKITALGIANSSATLHPSGTVVLSRDAGVGKSAIMRGDMAVSQHFMAWRCGPQLDNHYLYYWLQATKPEFERIANGSTIKTIGLPYFRALKVPLPPLPEQRAIATALSEVDGLIRAQEQLIAKKRDLKQAAMQQLLKPSKNWITHTLESIADVIDPHPSHRAPEAVMHGIPFVGIGDLDEDGNMINEKVRLVSPSIYEEHRLRYELHEELIGLGRVASIGKVVRIKPAVSPYTISPTLGIIRANQVPRAFLIYCLRSAFVTDQFRKIMSGSTRSSVGMIVLKKLKIAVPKTLPEQIAIAEVLSEQDEELAALEARLAKTRALKQGMMQSLLTGRIRLV